MDIKELNKSQLILLAVLLSFVTSIATGITTVTLLQQAPSSVTVPLTQIVRETVEKVAPAAATTPAQAPLSDDQKQLLSDLKAIKPLTVTLLLKGQTGTTGASQDKVLGTGLFLGDNKVVIASLIPEPKEGEKYIVRSVLGEQAVSKVTEEKDFTIIELVKTETTPAPEVKPAAPATPGTTDTNTTTPPPAQ